MTDTSLKTIIAIDGPAGAGKSTVAKRVAQRLGFFYIDTGAMYRTLALKAKRTSVAPGDVDKIVAIAKTLNITMDYDSAAGNLSVGLDGQDVTEEIREPFINEHVSEIAKIKEVREQMVLLQRRFAEGRRAILEGRDIGTIVFPDAYKKFYLDAKPEERIKRRYLEMKDKNRCVDEAAVKKDIEQRDRIDSTRRHAPLRRAADAVYIDTTQMTIEEVVQAIVDIVGTPHGPASD